MPVMTRREVMTLGGAAAVAAARGIRTQAAGPDRALGIQLYTVAADFDSFLGMLLEKRKHHLALAHSRGVLDLPLLGHGQKIGRSLGLQVGQVKPFVAHFGHQWVERSRRTGAHRRTPASRWPALTGC